MLHRDYLLEIIEQFVEVITLSLRRALERKDPHAAAETERAVAELVDLDPVVAMGLAPDSLVTMMLLSGLGDSVASYVAYTLNRLGDAYDGMGDPQTASLRRAQAAAVGESFGCDPSTPPSELEVFDRETSV